MAVTRDEQNNQTNVNSDILGALSGSVSHIDSTTSQIKTDTSSLKSIYDLLQSQFNQRRFSQSSANDFMYGSQNSNDGYRSSRTFRDRQRDQEQRGGTRDVTRDRRSRSNNNPIDSRDWDDFVRSLQDSLNNFTNDFNRELEDGLELSQLNARISSTTQNFAKEFDRVFEQASRNFQRNYQSYSDREVENQKKKASRVFSSMSSFMDDQEKHQKNLSRKLKDSEKRNAFDEFDDMLTEQFNKFSDGLADGFKESLNFTSFRDQIQEALGRFAKSIGSDKEHMAEDFGRQLSQAIFQESGLSDSISNIVDRQRVSWMRRFARGQAAFNNTRNKINPDADPNSAQGRTSAAMDAIREVQRRRMEERAQESQSNADNADDYVQTTQNNISDAIENSSLVSDTQSSVDLLSHISDTVDAILNNLDPAAFEDMKQKSQEQAMDDHHNNIQESAEDAVNGQDFDVDMSSSGHMGNIEDQIDESQNNAPGTDDGSISDMPDSNFSGVIDDVLNQFGGMSEKMSDIIGKGVGKLGNALEGAAGEGTMFGQVAQGLANALSGGAAGGAGAAGAGAAGAAGAGAAGAGLGGALAGVAAAAGPVVIGFIALQAAQSLAQIAIERFQKAIAPAKEAFDDFRKSLEKSGNFYWERRRKRIDSEFERIKADIETMVKKPFEIMEEAAQAWYDTWDQNLRTITGTQGYTKADLQDLMSSYAERLRDEGLGDIVSAADMTSQLAKVLESGLSGDVAEEFAYLATKLNAAIPNQDFFGYASEYASVAANAIQAGQDQASAIELANAELEQFASNVLYASRMISGGFSTSLQNAQDLFAKANQIARSAGMLDSSNISAVLTSVSAAVGAVAPQLADGLVSSIVDAAIGDNSETLTALRSLANTGASTTAFLREFANDPQGIFTTIFKNLSNLQNMNADNYMEVAQSLSSIFGIDYAAFAQIDFGSLANSVASMKVNSDALDENMKLLGSGETTTNEDQLRMQQINEMILNEGLSYVLDNEAARAIQQHMWDQELAQELMENTYGVELEGATFKLLEGIKETVHNIFNLLNPFSWVEKAFNTAAVVAQTESMKADIKRMLELGKVGAGNAEAFQKLTTYSGELLNNVDDLVSMMEGTSGANLTGASRSKSIFSSVLGMFKDGANALYDASYVRSHPISFSARQVKALSASLTDAINQSSRNKSPSSQYNWAYVGKSVANAMASTPVNASAMAYTGPTALEDAQSLQEAIAEDAASQMEAFLETMEKAAKYQVEWTEDRNGRKIPTGEVTSMSYDDWKETAADYGIEDLEQALADYGMTEEQLQGAYQDYQSAAASEYNWQREMYEWAFWESGINFWENAFPDEYRDPLFERFDHLLELTTHIDEVLTYWEDLWQYDFFNQSWSHDWLVSAWNQDWLKYAWNEDWLKNAWYEDWLEDAWAKYWEHWLEWYFLHEVYSEETGQAYQAADVVNASADYTGDAILALAGALTQNTIDLKDPTVQTNALLAQILLVAQGILEAENTSGSAALATTLAGLSLGFSDSGGMA